MVTLAPHKPCTQQTWFQVLKPDEARATMFPLLRGTVGSPRLGSQRPGPLTRRGDREVIPATPTAVSGKGSMHKRLKVARLVWCSG